MSGMWLRPLSGALAHGAVATGSLLRPLRVGLTPRLSTGVYKKEEAHLLLKAFHIKGPGDIFVSKFENDNWGLDGYVSARLHPTLWAGGGPPPGHWAEKPLCPGALLSLGSRATLPLMLQW